MQRAAAAFQAELVTTHPACTVEPVRLFAAVVSTQHHPNQHGDAGGPPFVNGFCRVVSANAGGHTVHFDTNSFAPPHQPIHVGPVKLPCVDALQVKAGDVLYGTAIYQPDYKSFLFRWCTRAPQLLALQQALNERSPHAVERQRIALQFPPDDDGPQGTAGKPTEDLVLLGMLLTGDLLAAYRLAMRPDTEAKGLGEPLHVLPDTARRPDRFVQGLALMCGTSEVFERFHNLCKTRAATVRPALLKEMKRVAPRMTPEVVHAFVAARGQAIRGDAYDAIVEDDYDDGADSDWSA